MLIDNDPDFVNLKRFEYNVNKVSARYPNGAPDHIIAGALQIPESEVQFVYEGIVKKLRILMGV